MTEQAADKRQRALDPERSFIVQAPAGSGKTGLLIQRFLTLLSVVEKPEEVLAITFTRKAAAEMRNRIVAALRRAADDEPPAEAHDRRTWRLARAALERDRLQAWRLTALPNRLRVQTIDSLCASLTRRMPVTSELGAPGRIEEDATALYQEAARATLAEIESDAAHAEPVEALLEHLGNSLAKLERLLVIMLAKRDQWLENKLAGHPRDDLEAALRAVVAEHLTRIVEAFPREQVPDLVALCRFAAGHLVEAGSDSPIVATAELEWLPEPVPEALPQWRGVAELLLTRNGTWRQSLDKRVGFPPNSAAEDAVQKTRFQAMKEDHAQLTAALSELDGLQTALTGVRTLPHARYSDEQWRIMQALFDLLSLAVAQLQLIFKQRGAVDFSELQLRAQRALGTELEPTDLALRLDYRISHILVDEFQDTSLGQFRLLEKLTAGWQPGDGRTLFLVGDPMQSIYRFRDAEVGLFLRAQKRGVGSVQLEQLQTRENFRSRREIVEWANAGFERVLPAQKDITAGAVDHARSSPTRDAGGAVTVHPFLGRDDVAEARRVVEIVHDSLARTDDDIAILVRGRNHLVEIVPRLRDAGIAFRAVELEQLGERPVVQDLLALTRAMLHPADRVAWLAVLRAPWCGLSLADLHALTEGAGRRTLWTLLQDERRLEGLSEDGRLRIANFMQTLIPSMRKRSRRGLSRWLEEIWLALGGPAAVNTESALDEAKVYFGLLDDLQRGGLTDLQSLGDSVEKMYAPPDASGDQRVQIMTIHKAKGLEFDTVILPGLGKRAGRDDPRLLMWLQRAAGTREAELLLAPIRADYDDEQDPIYAYLQDLHKARGLLEDGRLLYVAATRARERLHLLGHALYRPDDDEPPKPHAGSLLASLWPAVAAEFECAADAAGESSVVEERESPSLPQTLRRLRSDWRLPQPPESAALAVGEAGVGEDEPEAIEYEWARPTARYLGIVVHQALMRIARQGLDTWNDVDIIDSRHQWRAALAEQGAPEGELEELTQKAIDALQAALRDSRGRWILQQRSSAASEHALTGVLDGVIRRCIIDRTFVDEEGIRWIIDYKTGVHSGGRLEEFLDREQERYADQMARYAELFAGEDRPIRLGLYFPLIENGWREWAYP